MSERIQKVLSDSGIDWGARLIETLDDAGFVILPKSDAVALYLLKRALDACGNMSTDAANVGDAALVGARRPHMAPLFTGPIGCIEQ